MHKMNKQKDRKLFTFFGYVIGMVAKFYERWLKFNECK